MTEKDQCRAAFEDEFDDGLSDTLRRDESGRYINNNLRFAWMGWRLCWKHQSAELAARDAEIARLREAISLAYEAMNHMGDILNAHDMAEPESVEQVTPAFEAVRAALSQPASAPAAQGEQDSKAPYVEIPPGVFLWNDAAPKEPK